MVTPTYKWLVEEIRKLHTVLSTDARWAEMDADALWSGEQHIFVWQELDSGRFIRIELVINNRRGLLHRLV